jgi:hypothetical protein
VHPGQGAGDGAALSGAKPAAPAMGERVRLE